MSIWRIFQPHQEVIEEDIKNNKNRLKYYDKSKPGEEHNYIPIDSFSIIGSLMCSCMALMFYIFYFFNIMSYKSIIIDPIENIKSIFLNIQFIIIIVSSILFFIIKKLFKDENNFIKASIAFIVISIITLLVVFGVRLKWDFTYTREEFEHIYSKQKSNGLLYKTNDIDNENIQKDYYINECLKLYEMFKTKTYIFLGLHLLFIILLIRKANKILKFNRKRKILNKMDAIIFDEEQNVKI